MVQFGYLLTYRTHAEHSGRFLSHFRFFCLQSEHARGASMAEPSSEEPRIASYDSVMMGDDAACEGRC
jgi:hypothetical protein